jgi:thiol-disulfide isomerase/thioredoxin
MAGSMVKRLKRCFVTRRLEGISIWAFLLLVAAVAIIFLLILGKGKGSPITGARSPGEEIDVDSLIVEGQVNVFDFYSDYCPPCRKISPLLEKLDIRRDDILVIKIDINRPGVRGIDWRSPVARQFSLNSIPHFKIYDKEGQIMHEGSSAYTWLLRKLREEGLI